MEESVREAFANLESNDKMKQYEAFIHIMEMTKKKVDWAYDLWDTLRDDLTHHNAHRRARAAQFLANLAISDPENKMVDDFPRVWQVTMDEKFVTARHSLQAIWRVGLAGSLQKEMVLQSFADRYRNSKEEKNYTLIRFDIIQGLKNLYDETNDENIKELAMELIAEETDAKYKKKYASVWN